MRQVRCGGDVIAHPHTRRAMLVPVMTVVISMLRGVNVGGHNKIKMDSLRELYESLGLRDAQTYVQSGNVVFRTDAKNIAPVAKRIEDAIERKFGFRPSVILRTTSELERRDREESVREAERNRGQQAPGHVPRPRLPARKLARRFFGSRAGRRKCGSTAGNSTSIFPMAWDGRKCGRPLRKR